MMNDDIKKSKAYQTYLSISTGIVARKKARKGMKDTTNPTKKGSTTTEESILFDSYEALQLEVPNEPKGSSITHNNEDDWGFSDEVEILTSDDERKKSLDAKAVSEKTDDEVYSDEFHDEEKHDDDKIADKEKTYDERTESDKDNQEMADVEKINAEKAREEKGGIEKIKDDQVKDDQIGDLISMTHKEKPKLLLSTSIHSLSSNYELKLQNALINKMQRSSSFLDHDKHLDLYNALMDFISLNEAIKRGDLDPTKELNQKWQETVAEHTQEVPVDAEEPRFDDVVNDDDQPQDDTVPMKDNPIWAYLQAFQRHLKSSVELEYNMEPFYLALSGFGGVEGNLDSVISFIKCPDEFGNNRDAVMLHFSHSLLLELLRDVLGIKCARHSHCQLYSSYWQNNFPLPVKKDATARRKVIEFRDSYVVPANTTTIDTTSGEKSGRTVTLTAEDMQKKKNDVKARITILLSLPDEHQLRFIKYKTARELWAAILKTFGGNKATKKTKKNLLKQQYGNFKAEGSKTLEQTSDLDTMSLDDLYNHLKVYESEVQKKSEPNSQNMAFISSAKHSSGKEDGNTACVPTASTNVPTASASIATISQDTACVYIASQSSGSQIKFEDINQIDEDDMEEMDIKWNMELLSMRADKFWMKIGKKISIQGLDVAGFDKSKVDCFNCYKMGHFARECRAHRNQDKGRRDNYRQGSKAKEQALKELMAIYGVGWDWSYMANDKEDHALVADEVAPTEFALMANTSAESKTLKQEKEGVDGKLAGLLIASKDLENLIESQRSDKNKEGLGYTAVPPLPAQLYLSPKKDLSWTGLPECANDTVTDYSKPSPTVESASGDDQNRNPSVFETVASPIIPKPFIEFVKPKDSQSKSKTCKTESPKNPPVKQLRKVEEKGDEGYFIRYLMSSKAFRVFNKRTMRVEENLHVEFLENKAIEKVFGPNWLFDIDSLTKSMNYVPVDAGTISTNLSGIKDAARQKVKKYVSSLRYIALPNRAHDALLEFSSSKPQDHCSTEVPEGSGNPNPTASTSNPPSDQIETLTVETPIPTAKETPSLDNILSLTNRFEDILGGTTNSDESNGEEANISNIETSITASPTPTLRIHKDHPKSRIISPMDTPIQTRNKSKEVGEHSFIATIHQKTDPALLQFYLFSCFLSQVEPKKIFDALQDSSWVEDMQEELLQFKIQNVWTLVDCPKRDPEFLAKVYKVEKAMYGSHQAPRAWYGTLSKYLLKNGFRKGKIDHTLFIRRQREDFILVQVYADGIIFGSSNPQLCREFEALMNEKFQMSAMDIMLAVCACARHQVTPKECHLHAVKRIFRYLKGHPKLGLWYPKESPFDLVAYLDSDYGGATQDRKSKTGGCQFLGRRLISWEWKKQTIVATSTTKAEYVAAASCCG
nr:uncharacterized mitochondrial protein AtMg00810-like [Tanacetum cinerariifolium]